MSLRIGLHPDDLAIVSDARGRSYGELWTSPFLDRFYRPIVITLVRGSDDLFDNITVPLRLVQALLTIGILHTTVTMMRDRAGSAARHLGGLVALASPLTFVAVSPFVVGVSDLIVGWMFLLAVRACLRPEPRATILVVCSIVALFSKESGVLVSGYCVLETARHHRRAVCGTLCAATAAYLGLHSLFVSHRGFDFSTGYFFEYYSTNDLDRMFGGSPAKLYAYNVTSNLLDALVGVPDKGQITFPLHAVLLVPVTTITSVIVARFLTVQQRWRQLAPLIAVVLANAGLGYTYVRPRIMFLAGMAIAVLVIFTVDDLLSREQRVVGVRGRVVAFSLAGLWIAVLMNTLVRLVIQASSSAAG